MRFCTIIARNYWAHARVLARSVRDHHPDATITVLVIDGDRDTLEVSAREGFDVLLPGGLGVDPLELRRMAGIYDVLELSTALKPWLLRTLLDRDPSPVVYLDPDIELFASIDEVVVLAQEHGIVLTPHSVTPLPLDEYGPNELTILQSGTYNLGFIAVGRDAQPFLDWWAERLRRDCLIAKRDGLFVDQRWVDLVPGYFEGFVLRSPAWNVAYWNLPARHLEHDRHGYRVNGEPLRFFHYSGFDPDRPDRLSYYLGPDPQIRLEDHRAVADLCAGYADRLQRAGHRAWSRVAYPYDETTSGLRLDVRARRIYRDELIRSERGYCAEPPNPFGRPDSFERWLNEWVGPHEVTRYLRSFWDDRPDVQSAFPNIEGDDARLFVDWVRTHAASREDIPLQLVPRATRRRIDGVNLAGYVAAESGVGEGARLCARAIEAAGVDVSVFPYRNTRSRQEFPVDDRDGPIHNVNVLCVNADQLQAFLADAADLCPLGRYRVGVWAWEVDVFPALMAESALHVDEVWANSEHAARAIRAAVAGTERPVFAIPPAIVRPDPASLSRDELGLPDGFVFLYCFDFDSVVERKNPFGVVEAFRRAFPTPVGPQLVIKTVRGEAHPVDFQRLSGAAAGRPDVHVIDGYLDASEQHALTAACDAYVSLHRAEGFGLHLAEAMALGKPVVATAYSGNLEFMDETNSWLVPYELAGVPADCDPYPREALWAEPDLEAAAVVMREIVADPECARERGRRAADDMARLHSPSARARLIGERFDAIATRPLHTTAEAAPWTRVEVADYYAATGPDIGTPTRYGVLSRFARLVVMRVIRHFAQHQDRLHTTLVDSVRELQVRLAAENATVRELEAKIADLESKLSGRVTDAAPTAMDGSDSEAELRELRHLRERRG